MANANKAQQAELLRRNAVLDAADAAEKQRAGRVVNPPAYWLDSDLGVLWPWAAGGMAAGAYDPLDVLECAEVAQLLVVEAEAGVLVYGDAHAATDLAEAKDLAAKFKAAAQAFFAPHIPRLVMLGLCGVVRSKRQGAS